MTPPKTPMTPRQLAPLFGRLRGLMEENAGNRLTPSLMSGIAFELEQFLFTQGHARADIEGPPAAPPADDLRLPPVPPQEPLP